MKILVLLKMVPDVVEELEVAGDGVSLSRDFLRLIINERDENALEQALILKERHQATVIVVAPEAPEVDDVLFTALARGADRAIKVAGLDEGTGSRASAAAVTAALPAVAGLLPVDLILTGCQAIDDLDGLVGPLVAQDLGFPYVGIVTGLDVGAAESVGACEYPGGVRGSFESRLPAVVGIQGAEKPPRYVPIAKVRAAMAAGKIEVVPAPGPAAASPIGVVGMKKPEVADRAEMITGRAGRDRRQGLRDPGRPRIAVGVAMAGTVWVLAEQWRGGLSEVTFELLALGRGLAAGLGVPLEAVLLGSGAEGLAGSLGAADRVCSMPTPRRSPSPWASWALVAALPPNAGPGCSSPSPT